jgi:hypothetical protein
MSAPARDMAPADASEFRLLNAVFCEDIRHEDNGKDILIGVYSEVMAPSRCPIDLRLSLWIQYDAARTGDAEIRLRLRIADTAHEPPEALVRMSIAEPGEVTLALRGMPLSITGSGVILLEHCLPGEDWAVIARKRVKCPAPPEDEAHPPAGDPG